MIHKSYCKGMWCLLRKNKVVMTYTDRVVEQRGYELVIGGALAVHILHGLRSFFQLPCQLAILVLVSCPLQQHCMGQSHQHCLLC